MKKILLLTDNEELLNRFVVLKKKHTYFESHYAYSYNNQVFLNKFKLVDWIHPINVKTDVEYIINKYDILFSLHCKQIFPPNLINGIKCINIHPGFNPYNRGWYPQVFSIINGLQCGATIHEIDENLDHGDVICQREIKIEQWDTSYSAYNKILDVEIQLLDENLLKIINGDYSKISVEEGNLNLKRDFDNLCEINLENKDTFLNHINKLRALTHGEYSNAYFLLETGERVYLKLQLIK